MDDKTKNKIKYQNRKKEVKWIPLTQKYMTTPWLDTGHTINYLIVLYRNHTIRYKNYNFKCVYR